MKKIADRREFVRWMVRNGWAVSRCKVHERWAHPGIPTPLFCSSTTRDRHAIMNNVDFVRRQMQQAGVPIAR